MPASGPAFSSKQWLQRLTSTTPIALFSQRSLTELLS